MPQPLRTRYVGHDCRTYIGVLYFIVTAKLKEQIQEKKTRINCGNRFQNLIIFVCLKMSCFQTQPSSLFVRAKGSSEILASCMFNRREQLYCTWKSLLLSDFDQSYPRSDCNYSFGWVLPKRLQQGKRHWFITVYWHAMKIKQNCRLNVH